MRQRRAHRRRGCAGSSVPIWNLPASESALQSSRRSRRSPGIQPVHREQRSCRRRCRRSVCQCSARERGQYAPGSGLRPRVSTRNCRPDSVLFTPLFLAVFIKVFLAVSGHGLKTLATHSVSTLVDFTQRAVNGFHRHLRRLVTFQRIGDTRHQRFRQQPLQAGFAQLLSNLQSRYRNLPALR